MGVTIVVHSVTGFVSIILLTPEALIGGRCVDVCSQELGDGQLTQAIRTVLQNCGFSVSLQPVLRG
ncbi:MAG TPA: hypothetical protein VFQ02_10740, partial [Nitrospira sp.]|nr:hypothetical protein [Nitrospira sp.]